MKKITFLTILAVFTAAGSIAQPTSNQLAEQIIELNNNRLSDIQTLSISVEPEEAGFIPATTTHYVKEETNGMSVLVPREDDDEDHEMLTGLFDRQLPDMVRAAESITSETYNGYDVYRIHINDSRYLNQLSNQDFEINEEEDAELKDITLWMDSEELVPRRILFNQATENNNEVSVEIVMEDYQMHRGLPLAHTMLFSIDGLDSEFSEEDLAEARKAMQQMEEQLSQMPASQRDMIERHLKPQMERFEAILETGGMNQMVFRVVEVKVNE
jgi:hypothetical protein